MEFQQESIYLWSACCSKIILDYAYKNTKILSFYFFLLLSNMNALKFLFHTHNFVQTDYKNMM